MSNLEKYRTVINIIDDKILKLLEERMEIVKKVGEEKKISKINIYCGNREEEILKRLSNSSSLDNKFIKIIWGEIMNYSKLIQYTN